ncbi:ClbS/DfsB family four-helix bundle protein [Shimia ponticola]|uniref:ClbS/DfsB family four-helix bundle protein n=1 Tax=Shimia ponticola TaxID=2582893 RepID=UPI0011BD496C|nr:ClbS/DfsB family four-helix bundle protein [Shimia ponticola]
MPAATTKADLLAVTKKEFSKLMKVIDDIAETTALRKDDSDTSIKDVIAHRAHWIDLFLGWYSDGQLGREVCFPAKGYKWNDLKRYNADLREAQSDMGWSEARQLLRSRYDLLLDFMHQRTEAELYDAKMLGSNNKWTVGRWAEAAGPSHFRSAAKYVRSALRSAG